MGEGTLALPSFSELRMFRTTSFLVEFTRRICWKKFYIARLIAEINLVVIATGTPFTAPLESMFPAVDLAIIDNFVPVGNKNVGGLFGTPHIRAFSHDVHAVSLTVDNWFKLGRTA